MRQLIARVDDGLHERLKERAAAEHRSMNSLVQDLLERGLPADDRRERIRARAEAGGLRVVPRPKQRPPSRDAAIASTRGAGRAASQALAADRARG
jgi:plasmid stability protein